MPSPCLVRRRWLTSLMAVTVVVATVTGGHAFAQVDGTVSREEAEELLAQRPLVPTNEDLFTPGTYPGTEPLESPDGAPLSEDAALDALTGYVEAEFPDDAGAQTDVLDLFASDALTALIAEPSLRAALLGLSGTELGEVAIDVVLNPRSYDVPGVEFITIGSDEMFVDDLGTAVTNTIRNSDTTQLQIYVNPAFLAESPFALSRYFVGSLLYVDRIDSDLEQGIAHIFENLIYLEQISRHPELARLGTALARRNNVNAMARLNSGEGAELGLFRTNGGAQLLPGSESDIDSFWGIYDSGDMSPTPGNGLLTALLEILRESPEGDLPDGFTDETLDWLDENQGALSPETLAAAAAALELEPPGGDTSST